MTMYAMTDVSSVTIPDGCGESHADPNPVDGEHMVLDCPACEGALQTQPSLGWATHPGGVPLTPDERSEVDRNKQTADRVATHALASLAGAAVSQQAGPSQAMLDQMAAMQAQIVELTAKLNQPAALAPADTNEVDADPQATQPTPGDDMPKKRVAKKAAAKPEE